MKILVTITLFLFACNMSAHYANCIKLSPDNQMQQTSYSFHINEKDKNKNKNEEQDIANVDSLKDRIAYLEKQLQSQQKSKRQQPVSHQTKIDSLQRVIRNQDRIISDSMISKFVHSLSKSNSFFCRAVMESSFFYRYDYERVNFCLELAKAMGYNEKTNKLNWIYNVYYDLLLNYNTFNEELKEIVKATIEQFSMGLPNREFESERFEDRISNSSYYNVRGKGKDGTYRYIFYLDFQIERLRELFKNDASFKKQKFEEVLQALSMQKNI